MAVVYMSLGSNLGDRFGMLKKAVAELNEKAGPVQKISPIYETEPVGNASQPLFLNLCLELVTQLDPQSLLSVCQSIEKALGRSKTAKQKWASREIDIDILFYDQVALKTDLLEIPHPEIAKRKFVLAPLCDIAPEYKILLNECQDVSIVRQLAFRLKL